MFKKADFWFVLLIVAGFIYFMSPSEAKADTLYFKSGVGYKVDELTIYNVDTPINVKDTALFEIGVRDENLSYGFRHVSNWSTGWPLDNDSEYYKDEFFIEYEFDLLEF